MESSAVDSQLRASLEAAICNDRDVEFAVLFGSRASGAARPSSDVDVAVKFSDSLSSRERFEKRCLLAGTLQGTNGPFVDVSDIEELPLAVAHDAVTGDLLCGDEEAFDRFKSKVETTFEADRDELRRHQRDVIDRIADDGLHG